MSLRLYLAFVRASLVREMEFRGHFLLLSVASVSWTALSLALMTFVFSQIETVEGWNLERMIVLTGTWTLVNSLSSLLFARNMQRLSEYINKGDLDLILVKPINTQFYVSARFLTLYEVPAIVTALAYVLVGLQGLGARPGVLEVLIYLAVVGAAVVSLYAIWFMLVTLALWTGRIDNIAYAMDPLAEIGRVPTSIYHGVVRVFFTFVIPIAMVATVPTEALLGIVNLPLVAYGLVLALLLLWLSSLLWSVGLRRYASASS